MGEVHDILAARGKRAALEGGHERNVVEAAATFLGNEETGIGFLYSGWCQAALPHKRIADDQRWQVDGDRISLMIEPGARMQQGKVPIPVGVPYGSRARLILIYLQSEALRYPEPGSGIGRSMRQWFGQMGIPVGGKSVQMIRDQAERISRCKLTFQVFVGKRVGMVQQTIVDTVMFIEDQDARQGGLFAETARLSEGFFDQLQRHPVPLADAAIKTLANNSQAIDVSAWLAYRLHVLTKPVAAFVESDQEQFGQNVGRMDDFRRRFLPNLALAMAVYPDAKVEQTDTGLTLHPSRPPVAPKQIAVR